MKSLDEMTPRELCAGLMRGDRVDMRLGYSAKSAAITAAERNRLDKLATARLVDYAVGFADGMQVAIGESDPSVSVYVPTQDHGDDYRDGRRDGEGEEGFTLYPSGLNERGAV